jgi:hypothetical protein
MNCLDCHDVLQRYLDGAPVRLALLEPHLTVCDECRDRLHAAQRLADSLRLSPPLAPAPGLARRITGRVLADQRATRRFQQRFRTAAAVAAGLLLALFWGYQAHRLGWFDDPAGGKPGPGARYEARLPQTSTPSTKKESSEPGGAPSLGQTFTEVGTVALALTRRTAGETVDQARRLLPPAQPLPDPMTEVKAGDPLTPVLEPLAQSLREAGHSVSQGLQPVTASAPRAVEVLSQLVSPLKGGADSGS